MTAIRQAFSMQDAHFFVLKSVLNDIAEQRVRYTPLHPEFMAEIEAWDKEHPNESFPRQMPKSVDSHIDYEYYHLRFQRMLIEEHQKRLEAAKKAEEEKSKQAEKPEPKEFGGDYEQSKERSADCCCDEKQDTCENVG